MSAMEIGNNTIILGGQTIKHYLKTVFEAFSYSKDMIIMNFINKILILTFNYLNWTMTNWKFKHFK